MPSYLDAGPQDVYALNRLGSTFSDMVIGLQQNRMRQQQFLAQQALEAARIQIERERQQSNELTGRANRERYGAEADYRKAGAELERTKAGQIRTQGAAGEVLGHDLGILGNYPQGGAMNQALIGDIAKNTGVIAASHPSNIAYQTSQAIDMMDPTIRHLISLRAKPFMEVPAGGSLLDLTGSQPTVAYQAPPRPAAARDPYAQAKDAAAMAHSLLGKYGEVTPAYQQATNVLNATIGKLPGGAPQAAPIPKPGDIYKGYRFKGGDPSDKESWEPAQSQ